MASTAPSMYTDTPLALIHTPKFRTGKSASHLRAVTVYSQSRLSRTTLIIEASHLVLSYNSFIRGFNSIYQQAHRVKGPVDKSDFVGYCLAWIECVIAHHHYEETELSPNVDMAAGMKGLMNTAVNEHEAFYGGMEKMKKYLLGESVDFAGTELITIMDSFKEPLHSHLKAEPDAIVALAKYSTPDKLIDILGIAAAAGRKQVNLGFMFNTLPVFFLKMETVKFKGGMWNGVFPPLKGIAKTVVNKAVPRWHSGRWRFVSCSPDGEVKQLAV